MANEHFGREALIRLSIVVEGETEEAFVKEALAEHLRSRGMEPQPNLLGGNVTVERLASRMALLFWSSDRVTSLVDFYGFRDKGSDTVVALEGRINQAAIAKVNRSMDEPRVIPYVQKYEFEALLFTDVKAFGNAIGVSEQSIVQLAEIRSQFQTPEDINDNPATVPSKRIAQLIPRYSKVVAGPLVALETGLAAIRAQCPRFNQWITQLENI